MNWTPETNMWVVLLVVLAIGAAIGKIGRASCRERV